MLGNGGVAHAEHLGDSAVARLGPQGQGPRDAGGLLGVRQRAAVVGIGAQSGPCRFVPAAASDVAGKLLKAGHLGGLDAVESVGQKEPRAIGEDQQGRKLLFFPEGLGVGDDSVSIDADPDLDFGVHGDLGEL